MIKKTRGYIILLALMSFITSCDEKTPDFDSQISLDKSTLVVPSGTSIQTVQVLSNNAWEVISNVDWISFEGVTKGEKGLVNYSFQVIENNDVEEREGVLTFKTTDSKAASAVLTITQQSMAKENIYVKVNGTGEGLSWNDATSLDAALAKAQEGNKIYIAEGTYIPSVIVKGGVDSDEGDKTFLIEQNISLIGGFPENVSSNSTLPDPKQYVTTLSGDSKCYHVVTISAPMSENEEVKVVINGLTITGGHSTRQNKLAVPLKDKLYAQEYGGGIIVADARLDLISTNVIENTAGLSAGIHAFDGVILRMENCKVNNNHAEHHNAGLCIWRNGKVNIYDSEFVGNETITGVAAGIYTYSNGFVNLYNVRIADNKGGNHGGGLYIRAKSFVNAVNLVVSGNSIPKGSGAGIFVYDNSVLNLISSTVTNNTTTGKSGGLYMDSGDNILSIYNSIISGNIQGGNEDELARSDETTTAPVLKGTIVADKTYGASGAIEAGAVAFDAGSMFTALDNGLFGVIGDNNPAIKFGLTVDALISLGNTLDPVVSSDIVSMDINKNSRNNLTTMGAVVKN